jgi:hypothetical protein
MAELGIESTEAGTARRLSSDDRGLRVLGDHVPGVESRLLREEWRQPVAAPGVEEAIGAALGDRGDIGDHDREEIKYVGNGRPMEVAVRLHAAVERDDRVVDGRRQLLAGHAGGVLDRVASAAGDRGRASQ